MATFTSWLAEFAPRRLSFDRGKKLLAVIGSCYDVLADGFFYGISCRFPSVAPDDALPHIGNDRLIYQGPAESLTAYRERLAHTFDAWTWAGTEYGLRLHFGSLGLDDLVLLADSDWWHDEQYLTDWSRFWAIIPAGHYTLPSDEDLVSLKRIIETFRPAHVTCSSVIIIVSGRLVGYPTNQTFDELEAAGLLLSDSVAYSI
jgi:hypothetical protein